MYLFQKIKHGLELYSIEQGRQIVDVKNPLSYRRKIYTVDKNMFNSKRFALMSSSRRATVDFKTWQDAGKNQNGVGRDKKF